jgi:hypothetical protein
LFRQLVVIFKAGRWQHNPGHAQRRFSASSKLAAQRLTKPPTQCVFLWLILLFCQPFGLYSVER